MAKENEKYIGKEITEKTIEKIRKKSTKEGGKEDEQKAKRTRKTNASAK